MTANPVSTSTAPLSLVIVFTDEDRSHAEELTTQLVTLEQEGLVKVWHRGMIRAGGRLAEGDEQVSGADVVVLLVSAGLIAANPNDMKIALDRHDQSKTLLLPVRLRSAHWPKKLRALRALPGDGKVVAEAANRNQTWLAVVSELESALPDTQPPGGAPPGPGSSTPSPGAAPPTPRAAASPTRQSVQSAQPVIRPAQSPLQSQPAGAPGAVDGQRLGVLADALVDAFPTVDRLERMLLYRANRHLESITTRSGVPTKVYDVLVDANSSGWLGDLVLAARESNPGNGKLARVAETFVGIPTVAPANELQGLVDRARGFMDAEAFYSGLGKAIAATCRVEVHLPGDERELGTGFLVGPDLVMTNYHVIEALVKGEADHQSVVLRFDYRRRAPGATPDRGTEYFLAPKWLVDSSPYSRFDLSPHTDSGVPGDEELDYALLRVDGTPGLDSVRKQTQDPGPRGWLTPERNVTPTGKDPLLILQHPDGAPLKLDVHNFQESRGTRLRYTVNTEHGSSGSPVFDGRLRLIALHHSGDARVKPAFNEGIPFGAIWRLLDRRSFGKLLGQPVPVS